MRVNSFRTSQHTRRTEIKEAKAARTRRPADDMPAAAPNTALSGGYVRFGRWVPLEKHCKRGGLTQKPSGSASASILPPWDAPRMLRAYNASLDGEAEQATRARFQDLRHKRAAAMCGRRAASVEPGPAQQQQRRRCLEPTSLGALGVRLLIGVHTSPLTRARRDAIRGTWARGYGTTANVSLVCFIVGTAGERIPPELRESLEVESREQGDLVLLPHVEDGHCHITIEKAHGWWTWAAGTGVPHLARVDDDTFVHTPNLLAALAPLTCHRRLVFGALASVGYNPSTFRKCGYSGRGDFNWRRYGCAATGSHQPMLFPSGMLQVLSLAVARVVVRSTSVQEFVRRATQLINLDDWDRTEDVALGFWLGQLLAEQPAALPSITFVRATSTQAHNLGCQKSDSLCERLLSNMEPNLGCTTPSPCSGATAAAQVAAAADIVLPCPRPCTQTTPLGKGRRRSTS